MDPEAVEDAGRKFQSALRDYLTKRLTDRDADASPMEARYRHFLAALGIESNRELFDALVKHMGAMKDAGGVPKPRKDP